MKFMTSFAVLAGIALGGGAATAQTIGIGSTQRGVVPQLAAGIAKIVSEKTDLRMRTQGMASTGQYAPRVNAGQLQFGIANVIETTFSRDGKEIFEGRPPNPNLRMAITLFPFPVAYFVDDGSDIRSAEDLKGRRAPAGWTSQRLGYYLFAGFFANVGIGYDAVEKVALAAMPRMWDQFMQGSVDVAFATFGGSTLKEIEARVDGVRYIDLVDTPEAITAMRKFLPTSYVEERKTETGEAVKVMVFDYVVFTGADVPDDVVYRVVKAVHDSRDDLIVTSGLWRAFDPSKMAKDVEFDYHPGAVRFYKERGVWPTDG